MTAPARMQRQSAELRQLANHQLSSASASSPLGLDDTACGRLHSEAMLQTTDALSTWLLCMLMFPSQQS